MHLDYWPCRVHGQASESACAEAVDGPAREYLAGAQDRRREIAPVRRIWKVLRLETDAISLPVRLSPCPDMTAVERVARVEQQAWLGSRNLHDAARGLVFKPGCECQEMKPRVV